MRCATRGLGSMAAVIVLATCASPAPADDWVGKFVVPKRADFTLHVEQSLFPNFFEPDLTVYRVEKEEPGDRLRLFSPGVKGWALASDVVPVNDALDYFTKAIRDNPADAHAYAMRAAVRPGGDAELDQSMADYKEAIRLDPKPARIVAIRGSVWRVQGQFDKALADYNEAIRLDPKYAPAYGARASVWRAKRDYAKAIADYDELIRLDPKTGIHYMSRGRNYAEMRAFDKAIADYTEAIRLDPKFAPAYVERGNAWEDSGQHDRAIADYTEAIRLEPTRAYAYNARAIALKAKGKLDEAIVDYTESIRLQPTAVAYRNRGADWAVKGELDKALADYDEAIRLNPRYAVAYTSRGNAWKRKKEYGKALADINEALRLDPKRSMTYVDRGALMALQGEFDKALADYAEASRVDPKYAYPHLNTAIVRLILGDATGLAASRKTVELAGWRNYLSPYAALVGHFTARRVKQGEDAKRWLDDAAANVDKSKWPYPVIKYLRGEIDAPALLAAATDDVLRTEAHCYLGLDLLLKGRADEAREHFRWVKDHDLPEYSEFTIALAELERLESAGRAGSSGEKK